MHLPSLLFVMVSHRGPILWGCGAAVLDESAFRAAEAGVDKARELKSERDHLVLEMDDDAGVWTLLNRATSLSEANNLLKHVRLLKLAPKKAPITVTLGQKRSQRTLSLSQYMEPAIQLLKPAGPLPKVVKMTSEGSSMVRRQSTFNITRSEKKWEIGDDHTWTDIPLATSMYFLVLAITQW
ncbi:hypothetical protein ETB97_000374 [Aspergillus alliaceus]|uniref:Uncharacterized protein n=1 Tax=Petromyces alliaceus TaxID=209559 RepID=A0A8H6A4A2_PETAA|nr:hypothetical protein ETB97_000374 [Aspergillus burnettii]